MGGGSEFNAEKRQSSPSLTTIELKEEKFRKSLVEVSQLIHIYTG